MNGLTYFHTGRNVGLDDGTGRNIYFLDDKGKKTRNRPVNTEDQYFENGNRRYYYRGNCIRCRKPSPSVFFTAQNGNYGYCLNYCVECLKTTSKISSKSLKGKGDIILQENFDVPMHVYIDLKSRALLPNREEEHIERSKKATLEVNRIGKMRRNIDRSHEVRMLAIQHGIGEGGIHCSWGFGEKFDEYFGPIDQQQRPVGLGMMVYSDGSMYIGEWKSGKKHTTGIGLWTRPDGTQYEGSWINDLKHGVGSLRYPDQSTYVGEFAKGFEHGQGKKVYANTARFEGRFRFGKRDGPGVFTSSDGVTERRVFKENDGYNEVAVPTIIEEEVETETTKFFHPESLLTIAIKALAKTMQTKKTFASPNTIHQHIQEFLKPMITKKFLETLQPLGSTALIEILPNIAFQSIAEVSLNYIKFKNLDMESFLYCQLSNSSLMKLELVNNRLDAASLDLFCKKVMTRIWPHLQHLDLSYNRLDMSIIQTLMQAIVNGTPILKVLKLCGCQITGNECVPISRLLMSNNTLEELNLSFNVVQAAGAEHLAEALGKNCCLTSLYLRQNNIGLLGGEALMNALKINRSIRILCVADNKISGEIATGIAARLRGNTFDVSKSFCANELNLRSIHQPKLSTKSH